MTSNVSIFIILILYTNNIHCKQSTSIFHVKNLDVTLRKDICSSESTNCTVYLSFCAGVPVRHRNCPYLFHKIELNVENLTRKSLDIPVTVSWPTGPWRLSITGYHQKKNFFEFEKDFQKFDAKSKEKRIYFDRSLVKLKFLLSLRCRDNWYGNACQTFCDNSTTHDGHFTCTTTGNRQCLSGWDGKFCNETICEQPCIHGICNGPNTCKCDLGWRGGSCEECIPRSGCQQGFCKKAYECNCHPNWVGGLCNKERDVCLNHGICLNGGTCSSDGKIDYYYCNCTKAYGGSHCEKKRNFTCDFLNCGPMGVCHLDPDPVCVCRHGYNGQFCRNFDFDGPSTSAVYAALVPSGTIVLLVVFSALCFSVHFARQKKLPITKPMLSVYAPSFMRTDNLILDNRPPLLGGLSVSPPPAYSQAFNCSSNYIPRTLQHKVQKPKHKIPIPKISLTEVAV